MPNFPADRLTWVDETNRVDHHYLQEDDRCLFFGEYFRGMSYHGGDTNQLIFNFKCKPSDAAVNSKRAYYKTQAIARIAKALRDRLNRKLVERLTWVPIPTSKLPGHPDYDDRLIRTLQQAFDGYDVDIRPILRQTTSTEADHDATHRLPIETLLAITEVDPVVFASSPLREGIVLFDDLLTTGKHFKCGEQRVREFIPAEMGITGLFIARRISPPAEP